MKKFLFFVFISVLQVHAQNQSPFFTLTGQVVPKDSSFKVDGIHGALITLKGQQSGKVYTKETDEKGNFQLALHKLILDTLDTSYELIVSTKKELPLKTIDSVCPYYVRKSPKGYFDNYLPIKLNQDFQYFYIQLEAPLECYFTPFNLYFNKTNDQFIQKGIYNTDTMLMCIRNSMLKILKTKPKAKWCLTHTYCGEGKKAELLALKRLDKIKTILIQKYGIPAASLEIKIDSKENSESNVGESETECLVRLSIVSIE